MHIFVSILSEEFKKNTIFSKKISFKGFPCTLNFFHFKIQNQKKKFPRDCREFNSLKNVVFEFYFKCILTKLYRF
jgi:hypothetical protein